MNYMLDKSEISAFVDNVSWERIHLILEVSVLGQNDRMHNNLQFFGVNEKGEAWIAFDILKQEENRYWIHVNVANNGMCQCVPKGTYRIYLCDGQEVLADCEASTSIVADMDNYSRGFLYGGQNKSYNVNFFVEDGGETLPFRMRCVNLISEPLDFPETLPVGPQIKTIMKQSLTGTRPIIRKIFHYYEKKYRGKRDKNVLFLTEQSKTLGTNLTAVADRMKQRGLDKEFHICFSARKASDKNHGVKSWVHIMKLLAQSGTIFLDDHAPVLDWIKLPSDTCVVQLWHAGAGFKSSGYSRWGHIGCPAPQSCHRQYRYGIAGSRHIAHFFSEVWGINDEQVLPTGMPRMDEFLDDEYRKAKTQDLYEQFPMCKNKKVILFAPTYRGKNNATAYYPYELIDFDKLYELCGDEYVVLFKMHPWVIVDIDIPEKYKDKMMDVKTYPNINDLFYFTDLLITDYSSNIFEYSLMKKPMLFFAFDKVQYSFSRGFHRAYEESAPGKVCYTFEEVLDAIARKDFEYEKVEEYVEHHFDYIDSHASDRVIDWILLGQMPEEFQQNITRKKKQMEAMRELDFGIPTQYLGGNI